MPVCEESEEGSLSKPVSERAAGCCEWKLGMQRSVCVCLICFRELPTCVVCPGSDRGDMRGAGARSPMRAVSPRGRTEILMGDVETEHSKPCATKAHWPVLRLPPISEFGLLDIRKPTADEVRLGQVSLDCLHRIENFSAMQMRSRAKAGPLLGPPGVGSLLSVPASHGYDSHQSHRMPFPSFSRAPPTVFSATPSSQHSLSVLANMALGDAAAMMTSPQFSHVSQQQHRVAEMQQFVCKFFGCSKSFPSRSRLTRHELVHQGQKNFNCLYAGCLKRFSRKDNMLQHYRNHMSQPETSVASRFADVPDPSATS